MVTFMDKEKAFVESQRVMRFNSLTPDGRIHSVPICFAFDGVNLYAHAKSRGTRRWRDILENKTSSVELDYYSDDWSQLKGVLIDVNPVFVEPGPEQKQALIMLRDKYEQYWGMLDEATSMVRMEPTRIVSWGL